MTALAKSAGKQAVCRNPATIQADFLRVAGSGPAARPGTHAYRPLFCPLPRGLEGVLAEELDALGASAIESADGGVGFAGDFSLMMRVNLHSRALPAASCGGWAAGVARTDADLYRLPWASTGRCCFRWTAPSR